MKKQFAVTGYLVTPYHSIDEFYSWVATFVSEEAQEDFEAAIKNITNIAYLNGIEEGKKK